MTKKKHSLSIINVVNIRNIFYSIEEIVLLNFLLNLHSVMDDDSLETTLLVIKECYVYKIPPRKSVAGYKADDWDLNAPMWTGRVTVTGKGSKCFVKLEDAQTGEPFAVCPVSDSAIEPVTDSSRYFVMRIENENGKHAFIGIGFAERSEAFDFSAALQDHQKYVRQEKEAADAMRRWESMPHKDYSLPEGATIKVELKSAGFKKATGSSVSGKSSGGIVGNEAEVGFLLPPPKPTKLTTESSSASTSKSLANNVFPVSNNDWADFTGANFQSNQTQQPTFLPSNDFSHFSFSQPQSQQPQQQQQQQQSSFSTTSASSGTFNFF